MAVESLEAVHEPLGIEPLDVVHHLRVEGVGLRRRMVVAEVARCDEQRVGSLESADERPGQHLDLVALLAPHQERHDAQAGHEVLQERKLHLEGVLRAVRARIVHDLPAAGDQAPGEVFVDGRRPERRLERAARRHRHAVEGHPVGRTDENGGEALPAAEQRVGVRRHRPRVAQPGMRADETMSRPSGGLCLAPRPGIRPRRRAGVGRGRRVPATDVRIGPGTVAPDERAYDRPIVSRARRSATDGTRQAHPAALDMHFGGL